MATKLGFWLLCALLACAPLVDAAWIIYHHTTASGNIAFVGVTTAVLNFGDQNRNLTAPACTGSNTFMVLGYSVNSSTDGNVTGATYNGASIMSTYQDAGANGGTNLFIWTVVNPASAATFSVTAIDIAGASAMVASCYSGVNQTTPIRTATTGGGAETPATVDVTNSQANDLIVGVFGLNDTTLANGFTEARIEAGQTFRATATNATDEASIATGDEPGAAGTVTHSWAFANNDSNSWREIAIPLIPQ